MTYVMIAIPLYVFCAFSITAFAPSWGGVVTEVGPSPIALTFVGDMMFDRYIRERAERDGYELILRDVSVLFASSSFALGNLEGPITSNAPVADYRSDGPDHYRFTFAPEVASVLRAAGFTAVSLANNHVENFGTDGINETRALLGEQGLLYTGAPDDPFVPIRTTLGGVPVVVYGYSQFTPVNSDELLVRIAAEAPESFVVVYTHWGVEYSTKPRASDVTLAHALVDAGADLVIGSHPHVVQPKETYQSALIYYSLGNFVFDQYFSDTVRCGAVVSVTRMPDGALEVREDFVELASNGRTVMSDCMDEVPQLTE